MSLTLEAAQVLFEQVGKWWGPPALLLKPPAEFTRADDANQFILDGRTRFDALRTSELFEAVWTNENLPHLLYGNLKFSVLHPTFQQTATPAANAAGGQYLRLITTVHRPNPSFRPLPICRQLPSMLALAGHFERAWQYVPEVWRDKLSDLEAFLNVPQTLALRVWAQRKRRRHNFPRDYAREHRHDSGRILKRIRQLLVQHEEAGLDITADALRALIEGQEVDICPESFDQRVQ